MLQLLSEHVSKIVAHAIETDPLECCGLVSGTANSRSSRIYKLENVATAPQLTYEAAPEQLFAAQREIRERGERLLAIYHSHPRSAAPSPSETDVRLAYYPGAVYLIVGLAGPEPVVNAFEISEVQHSWEQVEYEILDE